MKDYTITINTKDVFYDVDKMTDVKARAADNGSNAKAADSIRSDAAGKDKLIFERYTANKVQEIYSLLDFCIKPGGTVLTYNNALDTAAASYAIIVSLPGNVDANQVKVAAQLVHEWVVNAVAVEWLSNITGVKVDNFVTEQNDLALRIRNLLSYKKRPTRPSDFVV